MRRTVTGAVMRTVIVIVVGTEMGAALGARAVRGVPWSQAVDGRGVGLLGPRLGAFRNPSRSAWGTGRGTAGSIVWAFGRCVLEKYNEYYSFSLLPVILDSLSSLVRVSPSSTLIRVVSFHCW